MANTKKRSRPRKLFAGFPALKLQKPTQAISEDICENPEYCKELIASMMNGDNPNRKICISIDISHLSIAARRAAPAHLGINARDPLQDLTSSDEGLHCKIIVELKAPALLIGDLHESGTSVFALGKAGLEFALIELAGAGIPKSDLDTLTTKHVSIISVPVAYVFCPDGQNETAKLSLALNRHTKLLGLKCSRTAFPCTVEFRGGLHDKDCAVTTTTNEADGHDSEEIVITKSYRPGRRVLQLELELSSNFLNRRNWVSLESWRDAYAEQRYETIFNENVRGLFRLDVVNSYTCPVIKSDTQSKISPVEAIFRDYLLGMNPMAFSGFPLKMSDHAKKKAIHRFRIPILDEWGIDILIEWRIHQTLQPVFLNAKLRYPGDFQPATKFVPSHFCKLNWPSVLRQLRRDFDEVACDSQNDGSVK